MRVAYVGRNWLRMQHARRVRGLTRESHVHPSSEVLSLWVAKLSNLLGITIHCTQAVTTLLSRRATYLRSQSRCIRGAGNEDFFQNWTLTLSPSPHLLPVLLKRMWN